MVKLKALLHLHRVLKRAKAQTLKSLLELRIPDAFQYFKAFGRYKNQSFSEIDRMIFIFSSDTAPEAFSYLMIIYC
jgi:hypothetical protein